MKVCRKGAKTRKGQKRRLAKLGRLRKEHVSQGREDVGNVSALAEPTRRDFHGSNLAAAHPPYCCRETALSWAGPSGRTTGFTKSPSGTLQGEGGREARRLLGLAIPPPPFALHLLSRPRRKPE